MSRLALHLSVTIIYEYQNHGIIRHTAVDHFIHNKDVLFRIFCSVLFVLTYLHTFHRACSTLGFFLGKQMQPSWLRSLIPTGTSNTSSVAQICRNSQTRSWARLVKDPSNYAPTDEALEEHSTLRSSVGNFLWHQGELCPIPKKDGAVLRDENF